MSDLEYIARNVHEWPEARHGHFENWDTSISCDQEKGTIDVNLHYLAGLNDGQFTHAQWQSERDRISGKPKEWVNDWAKFRAQDKDGKWFEHENEQKRANGGFYSKTNTRSYFCVTAGETLGDWRDTLEQRADNDKDDTQNSEDNEMEQVTLRPGDYCDVRGTTAEQRKAIADAFISAGASLGNIFDSTDQLAHAIDPAYSEANISWNNTDGLDWGFDISDIDRLLTIDQVLNATNAVCTDIDPVVLTNVKAFNEAPREALEPRDEWDGTGLPPVGEVCEFRDIESYTKCVIIAHHPDRDTVWAEGVFNDGSSHSVSGAKFFRPLPTDEDRAVEEMAQIINDGSYTRDIEHAKHIAQRYYRAGYRKTEQ